MEKTKFFTAYYNSKIAEFIIDFGNKKVQFRFCELLLLRKKIITLTSHNNIERIVNTRNIEILTVKNNSHIFVMDIPQLLDLRLLIDNIFQSVTTEQEVV
tara:strand:- start:676 stop:975 length:300 start_codon:yes stop_codon:yes gene_type:complete